MLFSSSQIESGVITIAAFNEVVDWPVFFVYSSLRADHGDLGHRSISVTASLKALSRLLILRRSRLSQFENTRFSEGLSSAKSPLLFISRLQTASDSGFAPLLGLPCWTHRAAMTCIRPIKARLEDRCCPRSAVLFHVTARWPGHAVR